MSSFTPEVAYKYLVDLISLKWSEVHYQVIHIKNWIHYAAVHWDLPCDQIQGLLLLTGIACLPKELKVWMWRGPGIGASRNGASVSRMWLREDGKSMLWSICVYVVYLII